MKQPWLGPTQAGPAGAPQGAGWGHPRATFVGPLDGPGAWLRLDISCVNLHTVLVATKDPQGSLIS